MIRIGSLCSGYGGLDWGLSLALEELYGDPGEVLWHAEYDEAPAAVLAHHWPGVPNLRDVTAVDWSSIERVDWLAAGFPCQPFSLAGKRKGKDDVRHLWPHIACAVGVLRPRWVFLENVAGHVSMGLGDVLGDLAGLGYDAAWGVVPASAAGAPHRRRRVFIVGRDRDPGDDGRERGGQARGGRAGSAYGDLTAADPGDDGRERGAQLHGGPVETAGRADARGRHDADGLDHAAADPYGDAVREQPIAEPWGGGAAVAGHARRERLADAHSDRPGPQGSESTSGLFVPAWGTAAYAESVGRGEGRAESAGREGGPDDAVGGGEAGSPEWGAFGVAVDRWARTLGRPAPLPWEWGTRGNRRLNPLFVEWMMGLDEGHVTGVPGLGRRAQLKALGNGVVPQQAALAVRMLVPMLMRELAA